MEMTSYKAAGVDIDKTNQLVSSIDQSVSNTFSPAVLSTFGGFAGLYDLSQLINEYQQPVLVQSIDGVGTKTMVAQMMNDFSRLGQDLVSATVNDILVCGAKPLTLLDYVASSNIDPAITQSLIESIAESCQAHDISLVGGETAEMPGTYAPNEYDVVAVVTGVVDKERIINGSTIQPSDVVVGLQSSGLHTNGFSLARKILFSDNNLSVEQYMEELQTTLGDALLAPHINYCSDIQNILCPDIHGMAHITGGGLIDNLQRILPNNCAIKIDKTSWQRPAIFEVLQTVSNIQEDELFKAFNMGIGYCLIVNENAVDKLLSQLNQHKPNYASIIGHVVSGSTQVTWL